MPLASVKYINNQGKEEVSPVAGYGCWGSFRNHGYVTHRTGDGGYGSAKGRVQTITSITYYPYAFQRSGYGLVKKRESIRRICDVVDYLMEGINNIKAWAGKVTVHTPKDLRYKLKPLMDYNEARVNNTEAFVSQDLCFEVSTDMEPEELYALLLILRKVETSMVNSLRTCRDRGVPAKYGIFLAEAFMHDQLDTRPQNGAGITLKTGRENLLEIIEKLGNTGEFYPTVCPIKKSPYSAKATVDMSRMGVKLGLNPGEERYSKFFEHKHTFGSAIEHFLGK